MRKHLVGPPFSGLKPRGSEAENLESFFPTFSLSGFRSLMVLLSVALAPKTLPTESLDRYQPFKGIWTSGNIFVEFARYLSRRRSANGKSPSSTSTIIPPTSFTSQTNGHIGPDLMRKQFDLTSLFLSTGYPSSFSRRRVQIKRMAKNLH